MGNASSKGVGTSQGWGKILSSSISLPVSVLTLAGEVPTAPFYINKGTGCFWMGFLVSPLLTQEIREPQLIAHTNLMEPVGPRSSALTKPLLPPTHHPSLKSYFLLAPQQPSCLTHMHTPPTTPNAKAVCVKQRQR